MAVTGEAVASIEIIVINLRRSTERRAQMAAVLNPLELPYSFFEAVDGREGEHPLFKCFSPRHAETRRGFALTPSELGCYASHYLLWERCVEKNRSLLIFEDDVRLNGNFREAYDAAAARIRAYGLLRFSGHKRRAAAIVERIDNHLDVIRFKIGPHGTSCYAVSPAAAAKLLAKAKVWFEPVDCHLDQFWTHGVGSYGLFPLPVTHLAETAEQSDIWQGTKRAHKSRRNRKLRALYRTRDDVARFLMNLRYIGRWQN